MIGEKRDGPKPDIEAILSEFEVRQPVLNAFCARTKALIEACLQDAGIRYQSIQARVKTKSKLRRKYTDPTKDYVRLDDITDLAGLRIITYYDDEVDEVARLVEKEFEVDKKESVDKRDIDPDRFGYRAINFICGHLGRRTSDVEYKQFVGVRCEIQITSILGHAWSEIEHEWYDLKDAYPREIKRRFSRVAALFELAGQEFVDIRKKRLDYERLVSLRVEANVSDIEVNGVSLRSFIERDSLVQEVDSSVGSALNFTTSLVPTDRVLEYWSKMLKLAGINNLQQLRENLLTYRGIVPQFIERCQDEVWTRVPMRSLAPRGVSIYHLSLLLAALAGETAVAELFGLVAAPIPSEDIQKLSQIAKGIIETEK